MKINALNLVLTTLLFSPFIFLGFVLVSMSNQEPQHDDTKIDSGWIEIKLRTVGGDIIYLSCPQRRGSVMGGHSVDCYAKLTVEDLK